MEPVRVGVLGAGAIACEIHLPILRRLTDVELVGVADPRPESQAAARAFGLPVFASSEALLDTSRLDCAFVLTPKETHPTLSQACLARGLDVFCEKPLAMRLVDAEATVAAAESARRLLMVGFNRRFAPVYERAHAAFRERRLDVCLALKNRPGSEYRASLENAIHMVDLLRWFCGEATHVTAEAQHEGDPFVETSLVATIRFASGALGGLVANRSTSHWVERLECYGSGWSAVVGSPDWVRIGHDGVEELTEMTPQAMGWAAVADKMGFRQEVEHFLECVRARSEPRTSGQAVLGTHRLMHELLVAAGLPGL
jgi:virulence factor